MTYAMVMQVKFDGSGTKEDGIKMLEEFVMPHAKSQPGFDSGIWMRSLNVNGLGVVVFDTEENAKAAAEALKPPPGGPELVSAEVYEVGGRA